MIFALFFTQLKVHKFPIAVLKKCAIVCIRAEIHDEKTDRAGDFSKREAFPY
jgi:hypothetical protein